MTVSGKLLPAANRRVKVLFLVSGIAFLLLFIALWGALMDPARYAPDYAAKKLPPSLGHLFGTDFLGRDMFFRTVKGLSTSIMIGALAATVSACIALVFGIFAASAGGVVDKAVSYCVDLWMGIPHIVLLMLVSIMLGRGTTGIIIGVAVTHWPNITRVIRAEVLEVREAQYVKTARQFGKGAFVTAWEHIVPHVFPQFLIGLILLFPHAILHEAGLTFLGYGLPLDTPAVGIILSESMKHIATGMWWLVLLPGLTLLAVVMLFDKLGGQVKLLLDPASAQE